MTIITSNFSLDFLVDLRLLRLEGLGGVVVLFSVTSVVGDPGHLVFFLFFDADLSTGLRFLLEPVLDVSDRNSDFAAFQHSLQRTGVPFWSSDNSTMKSRPHKELRQAIVVLVAPASPVFLESTTFFRRFFTISKIVLMTTSLLLEETTGLSEAWSMILFAKSRKSDMTRLFESSVL